jgi:o-succinylbenzoate synthase
MQVSWEKYVLRFRERAITSRNSMLEKSTWLLRIRDEQLPGGELMGEAAMFEGLSQEDTPAFEAQLDKACSQATQCSSMAEVMAQLPPISAIRFGFESALLRGGLYPTSGREQAWLNGQEGLRINGLVWMGDKPTMRRRIREKLDAGFRCVKLKIGGIDFEDEVDLLRLIRQEFSPAEIELRLDANGGFTPENALERLNRLAEFEVHSLEQPIKPKQFEAMHRICRQSPIPIALDEELIGFHTDAEKQAILTAIQPQYIILKPSLCGGFREADRWIALAQQQQIGWWATSALESNIGLEAIARWTASKQPLSASEHPLSEPILSGKPSSEQSPSGNPSSDDFMPQGLGTGNLYTNNLPSPLTLRGERLWYRP